MYACFEYYIVHANTQRAWAIICGHTHMYLHENICMYTCFYQQTTYTWVHTLPDLVVYAKLHFCLDRIIIILYNGILNLCKKNNNKLAFTIPISSGTQLRW